MPTHDRPPATSAVLALALSVACSPSAPAPSSSEAPAPSSGSVVIADRPCETDWDCTLVAVAGGRLEAAPVGHAGTPRVAPVANGPLVTPRCGSENRCELFEPYFPEMLRCSSVDECTVFSMAWGAWYPVRVDHEDAMRAELLAEVEELGAPLLSDLPPRPGLACLAGACVTRRP